jgi:23S rRNA A2030 N6-methylase RlmJ
VYKHNKEIDPNAGNFQEYNYELEWMEAHWNHVYKCIDMVTAYWYPWMDRSALHRMYYNLDN